MPKGWQMWRGSLRGRLSGWQGTGLARLLSWTVSLLSAQSARELWRRCGRRRVCVPRFVVSRESEPGRSKDPARRRRYPTGAAGG